MEKFLITIKGVTHEVEVEKVGGCAAPAPRAAAPVAAPAAAVPAGATTVNAPMPGKILAVNIKPGDSVKRGDTLLVLEAMKMANEIMAAADGKVTEVRICVGQMVSTGDAMVILG